MCSPESPPLFGPTPVAGCLRLSILRWASAAFLKSFLGYLIYKNSILIFRRLSMKQWLFLHNSPVFAENFCRDGGGSAPLASAAPPCLSLWERWCKSSICAGEGVPKAFSWRRRFCAARGRATARVAPTRTHPWPPLEEGKGCTAIVGRGYDLAAQVGRLSRRLFHPVPITDRPVVWG